MASIETARSAGHNRRSMGASGVGVAGGSLAQTVRKGYGAALAEVEGAQAQRTNTVCLRLLSARMASHFAWYSRYEADLLLKG